MKNEEDINVKEISQIVARDFSLQGFGSVIKAEHYKTLNEFKAYLTKKLDEMMDKNYDLLIKTLYRIDIDEQKLQKLFAADNREFVPEALADLIIERQIQKIHFRKKYRSGEL